jgi:hypothetical protein
MDIKQKLELTLNRLYKENKLSIDTYAELMEFADPNQALQLQQTGVIKSVCVSCGKPVKDFNEETNNCCDECWLSA